MMRSLLVIVAAMMPLVQPAAAGDHMWIVGSYSVLPFTTAVATRVAKAAGGPAPIVEDTGSSALAFEYLCGGAGFPNAVSVTRRMKRSELDACVGNGITEIVETKVGLDILVVAQAKAGPLTRLTLAQMFLALARSIPDGNGELIVNPHRRWSEIDRALPDVRIDVRVLPQALGTRDELQDLFLQKGAERIPGLVALMAKDAAVRKTARTIRRDHSIIVEHQTEDVIVRELLAHPNAVGILGYRFLEANRATLRGVTLDGADADQDAYSAKYPGARKIYLYTRKADIKAVPGLDKLGAEYFSSAALGAGGYLIKQGFVPLPMDEMMETMALLEAMPPVRREVLPE